MRGRNIWRNGIALLALGSLVQASLAGAAHFHVPAGRRDLPAITPSGITPAQWIRSLNSAEGMPTQAGTYVIYKHGGLWYWVGPYETPGAALETYLQWHEVRQQLVRRNPARYRQSFVRRLTFSDDALRAIRESKDGIDLALFMMQAKELREVLAAREELARALDDPNDDKVEAALISASVALGVSALIEKPCQSGVACDKKITGSDLQELRRSFAASQLEKHIGAQRAARLRDGKPTRSDLIMAEAATKQILEQRKGRMRDNSQKRQIDESLGESKLGSAIDHVARLGELLMATMDTETGLDQDLTGPGVSRKAIADKASQMRKDGDSAAAQEMEQALDEGDPGLGAPGPASSDPRDLALAMLTANITEGGSEEGSENGAAGGTGAKGNASASGAAGEDGGGVGSGRGGSGSLPGYMPAFELMAKILLQQVGISEAQAMMVLSLAYAREPELFQDIAGSLSDLHDDLVDEDISDDIDKINQIWNKLSKLEGQLAQAEQTLLELKEKSVEAVLEELKERGAEALKDEAIEKAAAALKVNEEDIKAILNAASTTDLSNFQDTAIEAGRVLADQELRKRGISLAALEGDEDAIRQSAADLIGKAAVNNGLPSSLSDIATASSSEEATKAIQDVVASAIEKKARENRIPVDFDDLRGFAKGEVSANQMVDKMSQSVAGNIKQTVKDVYSETLRDIGLNENCVGPASNFSNGGSQRLNGCIEDHFRARYNLSPEELEQQTRNTAARVEQRLRQDAEEEIARQSQTLRTILSESGELYGKVLELSEEGGKQHLEAYFREQLEVERKRVSESLSKAFPDEDLKISDNIDNDMKSWAETLNNQSVDRYKRAIGLDGINPSQANALVVQAIQRNYGLSRRFAKALVTDKLNTLSVSELKYELSIAIKKQGYGSIARLLGMSETDLRTFVKSPDTLIEAKKDSLNFEIPTDTRARLQTMKNLLEAEARRKQREAS